jgi:hypothetical protein
MPEPWNYDLDLRVFCPKCEEDVKGVVRGSVQHESSGCDSCGYGTSVDLTVTIECPTGHTIWQRSGDADGVL